MIPFKIIMCKTSNPRKYRISDKHWVTTPSLFNLTRKMWKKVDITQIF